MSTDRELAAWLRLAILLRRDAAKLAAREGGTWTHDGVHTGNVSSLGGQVVYDEGSPDEHQAAHIAMNDPRDVIARCEAELAILDLCAEWAAFRYVEEEASAFCLAQHTVRLLAGGYKNWPGYREEAWKP